MDNKHIKIKTVMKKHVISARSAIIRKKWKIINAGEDVENLEPLHTAVRNVKCCSCCIKQFGSPQKVKYRIAI